MRAVDWVERLHTVIEKAEKLPFDYGGLNCGSFVAQCVDAITGSGKADELRTRFDSAESAQAFLDSSGGIVKATTERLGEPKYAWTAARRGDVCLVMTQDGPGLGVCVGSLIAMPAKDGGLTHVKIDEALRVWRID